MKNTILAIFILGTFTACVSKNSQNRIAIKDYYFPYDQMTKEQVYCFQNTSDSTDKVYWRMHTKITGTDTLFISEILNSREEISEYLVEKIGEEKSSMQEYILFAGEVADTCEIIDNTILKWEMAVGETSYWKVHFPENESDRIIEFSKQRTLTTIKPDANIIEFKDNLQYSYLNSNMTYDYSIEFVYAKSIGAIRYKVINDKETKEYELVR